MIRTISPQDMREMERAFLEGTGYPSILLMEHAAQAVVDALSAYAKAGSRVLFVCGSGNNGGDGCAAARLWMQRGGQADVWLLKSPSQMKGDAGVNGCLLNSCGAPLNVLYSEAPEVPGDCAAIVDALYGTGLSRELDGAALSAVRRIGAGARRRGARAGDGGVSPRQARAAALSGARVCGQADRRGHRNSARMGRRAGDRRAGGSGRMRPAARSPRRRAQGHVRPCAQRGRERGHGRGGGALRAVCAARGRGAGDGGLPVRGAGYGAGAGALRDGEGGCRRRGARRGGGGYARRAGQGQGGAGHRAGARPRGGRVAGD